jgi:GTP cyclohydrolase II
MHCDCLEQAEAARRRCSEERGLILLETAHEGRGFGLAAKAQAYDLMLRTGVDTFEANRRLGLCEDARSYDDAAAVLRMLGISAARLLSENPAKRLGLEAAGVGVVSCEPLTVSVGSRAAAYRQSKLERWSRV